MELRTEFINKKKVFIIDDYFENRIIEDFYEFAKDLSYSRSEKSTASDEYPKYVVNFHEGKFLETTDIGKGLLELFKKYREDHASYKPFRAYINLSNYGDVEWPHRDCSVKKDDITILYYINKEWDYKYGGETLFYLQREPKFAVLPKPGRIVIFDGNIEHIGGLPNRTCKLSRYSLALKFKKDEN